MDKEQFLEEHGVQLHEYRDGMFDAIYYDRDRNGLHGTVIDPVERADTREEAVVLAYSWLKSNIAGV